jgi:hypothetical protein
VAGLDVGIVRAAIGQPIEAIAGLLQLLKACAARLEGWRQVDSPLAAGFVVLVPVDGAVVNTTRIGAEGLEELKSCSAVEAWRCVG